MENIVQNIIQGRAVEQVVAAIQNLDLGPIKVKLMDAEEGQGWSREYVEQMETAYKRFLILLVKYQDQTIAPSKDVDKFWHGHILDTMKYVEDCDHVFGHYLHHFPYFGMRGEADAAELAKAGDTMARLYAAEFGEAQPSKAAFCSAAITEKPAFCSAAGPAFCSAAGVKAKPAFCSAAQPAFCSAAGVGAMPAFCSAAAEAVKAAFCSAAVAAKPAFCSAAKPAFCSSANVQTKTAFCSAAAKAAAPSFCSAASTEKSAFCSAAGPSFCSAAGMQAKPAFCSAGTKTDVPAFCSASGASRVDTTTRPTLPAMA
jgi:hypothetical protein